MALRKILTQGDPSLEKACRPVEKFDRKLHWLLDDLKETLENAGGVGLAAPQIGILRRAVIVMDDEDRMLELVNSWELSWLWAPPGSALPRGCFGKCLC